MDCTPLFESRRHKGCLRGLHFLYEVNRPWDREGLHSELARAGDGCFLEATEAWGTQRVHRLIYQFRFEIRIGSELALIHRLTASPEQREADREWFEKQLERALGCGAHQESLS